MIKIYCIECLETGEKYIGSTSQKYLCNRLSSHKVRRSCRAIQILDRGKYKSYIIEKVEPSQRYIREQYYMDITDNCINKQRAIGCDRKEYKKQYDILNKDYKKEQHKYKCSWGGDRRYNNNLLMIDTALFASK